MNFEYKFIDSTNNIFNNFQKFLNINENVNKRQKIFRQNIVFEISHNSFINESKKFISLFFKFNCGSNIAKKMIILMKISTQFEFQFIFFFVSAMQKV